MQKKQGNDQMLDYAGTDARSVKAMLTGNDDGRTKAYECYRAEAVARKPDISEEELAENYRAYSQLAEHKRAWREGTLDKRFRGYSRTFLAAFRAREDSENAIDQAANCHPGEIFDLGFDSVMTHIGKAFVVALVFLGITYLFP